MLCDSAIENVVCLEIRCNNMDSEEVKRVLIPADRGELFIFSEAETDIHVVVEEANDQCACVELIALQQYSIVYHGKSFCIPLGESAAHSFSVGRNARLYLTVSYSKTNT